MVSTVLNLKEIILFFLVFLEEVIGYEADGIVVYDSPKYTKVFYFK